MDMHFGVISTAGRKALKEYVMKSDTREAGPWADRLIDMGQRVKRKDELVPWQKWLLAEAIKAPDMISRKIKWFWCKDGGSGKSAMQDYLEYHHAAVVTTTYKAWDLAKVLMDSGHNGIVCVNLPKSRPKDCQDLSDLVSGLEQIKDGRITSTKGSNVGNIKLPPCHLFVFANEAPPTHAATDERWEVFKLDQLPKAMITEKGWDCSGVPGITKTKAYNEKKIIKPDAMSALQKIAAQDARIKALEAQLAAVTGPN